MLNIVMFLKKLNKNRKSVLRKTNHRLRLIRNNCFNLYDYQFSIYQ